MGAVSLDQIRMALQQFSQEHSDIGIIGIFGSYAKNTYNDRSDIDVCVAKKRPLSMEEKIELATKLSLLLKKEVDVLDLHRAHGLILEEALHSSIWLAREPEVFAQILKRMLFDKADFEPYRQRIMDKKRERFLKK